MFNETSYPALGGQHEPTNASLAFDLKASEPAWITIVRCDRPELLYLWADEPQINAYLDVGRYLVSADAYADVDTSATVTARRLAEAPDFATVYDAPPRGFVSHRAGDRRHE